jgi:hypothetical protein
LVLVEAVLLEQALIAEQVNLRHQIQVLAVVVRLTVRLVRMYLLALAARES